MRLSRTAINETAGIVETRLTAARAELARTRKKDPLYKYILERIEKLEQNAAAIRALEGVDLPESKRDAWKKKLGKG